MQDYTYMFYKVWSMGMPVFDDSIPTAGVGFDRANGHLITFRFNPKFWDKCTQYQRAFVVAHEALHVILNHGVRGLNANFQELSNIAMDIPINHMLVDDYGFDRNKLGFFSKDFCWRDTVFSADKNIVPLADQSYEYYYSLLERNASFVIMPNSFDDHSGLGNIPSDVLDRLPNDVKQEIEDGTLKVISVASGCCCAAARACCR